MNITSVFLENLSLKAESGQKEASSGGSAKSFQSIMEVNTEKTSAPVKQRPERTNTNGKKNTASVLGGTSKQAQPAAEPNPEAETLKAEAPSDKSSESSAPVTNKDTVSKPDIGSAINKKSDTTESDSIALLSSEIGIPVEALTQILDALGLTVADLTDKSQLNLFMQKLYDVNSPVELLNMPGIQDVFGKIDKALNQLKLIDSSGKTGIGEASFVKSDADTVPVAVAVTNRQASGTSAVVTHVSSNPAQHDEAASPTDYDTPTANAAVTESIPKPAEVQTSFKQFTDNPGNENEGALMENTPETGLFHSGAVLRDTSVKTTQAVRQPVVAQEIINQLADKIKVDVRSGVSEVRLLLRPESLGEVTLKIATQNGIVSAQFVAENQRVKEVIESNFNQLKDLLAEKGIEVSSLSVSVDSGESNEAMENYMRESAKSSRRISQILSTSEAEPLPEAAPAYAEPNQVYDNTVNYTA